MGSGLYVMTTGLGCTALMRLNTAQRKKLKLDPINCVEYFVDLCCIAMYCTVLVDYRPV